MKTFEEFLNEDINHIKAAFHKVYGYDGDIVHSKQTKPDPKHPGHTVHMVVSHDKTEGNYIVGTVRMNGKKMVHHDHVPSSEHPTKEAAIRHVEKHA